MRKKKPLLCGEDTEWSSKLRALKVRFSEMWKAWFSNVQDSACQKFLGETFIQKCWFIETKNQRKLEGFHVRFWGTIYEAKIVSHNQKESAKTPK